VKNTIISPMILLITLFALAVSYAQSTGNRITIDKNDRQAGEYNIPYEVPPIDTIKSQLTRIYNYLYPQITYRVYDRKTHKPITDFSTVNPNADLNSGDINFDRDNALPYWSYPSGVAYSAMIKISNVTGDKKFLDFTVKCINHFFNNLPYFKKIDSTVGQSMNNYRSALNTSSLDDCGSMGAALIRYYKISKDPSILPMINHIADFISGKQFRLADGTLARQRPQAKSVWADDAYMSIPFLSEMGSLSGDSKYYDDAAKQVVQMSKYLFRWGKQLFDHGVNIQNEYDPDFFWGRANGWVIISIVDLLDVLPDNHKDRDQILKILRTHIKGLAEVQGADGFWHNLLDKPDSYTETSCTALFTYSIAHAINKGWADYTYGPVAQAGWNALASRILPNGQVEGTCIGTTFGNEAIYYYHRPTSVHSSLAYGPVLMAGAEIISLFQNDKLVIRPANGTFHYRLKSEVK
jgi:unsaturated rhamnogalacturonyl hydrolase